MPGNDDTLRIVSQFDVTGITAGVGVAADAVEAGTARMNQSFERVAVSSEHSVTEARHALHGLGEEIGIHVPRFVQSFVSNLGGVGPALAAAFTPIAIIGVGEVLFDVGKKLYDFYENVVNLKGAMEAIKTIDKTFTEDQIEMSNALLTGQTRMEGLLHGPIAEGKSRIAALGAEIVDLGKMLDVSGKSFQDLALGAKASMREFLVPTQAKDLAETLGRVGLEIKRVQSLLLNTDADTTEYKELAGRVGLLSDFYNTLALKVEKYNQEVGEAGAELHEKAQQQLLHEHEEAMDLAKAYERLGLTQRKLADDAARFAEEQKAFGTGVEGKGSEEQLKAIQEVNDAEEKFRQESEQRAMEAANFAIDQKIRQVEAEKDLGEISVRDATAQINSLTAQRLAADEKMLSEEMAIIQGRLTQEFEFNKKAYTQDLAEYSALLKKKEQLEQQAAQQMEKSDDQAAKQMLKSYETALKTLTTDFNKNIIEWTTGQETFGKAAQKVWTNMVTTAEGALLRLAEEEIAGMLLQTTLVNQQKVNAAQTAAANTYAAISAIPIIGPELAEPAAIAAYAAVMAFEKGGIVPDTGLALLHPREMVLPAPISESVQKMAAGGGGRGGGTHHYHVSVNTSGSKEEVQQMVRDAIIPAIKQAQRRGRFDTSSPNVP